MKLRAIILLLAFLIIATGATPDGVGAEPSKVTRKVPVQLQSPVRLALSQNGDLLVSDYRQQLIFTLSWKDLEVVESFAVSGRPLAVACGKGRVYVGNESTSSVEVYKQGGKWLYNLGNAVGNIGQPTDIALDEGRGLIFVVDGYEKLLKVFDAKGSFLYSIPRSGPTPEQLMYPTGIAVDEQRQQIVVGDYGDPDNSIPPRVQIFDYQGNHLKQISGKAGMLGFRFSRPQGLAVDDAGYIFLVDSLLGQVLVLDPETGTIVKTLGSFGFEVGQLLLPLDIVLDDHTLDVYVTNNRNERVEVFRQGGLLP